MRDVMRYMIFRNEVKPGVPVPRGDLTKLFPALVRVNMSAALQRLSL